MASKITFLGIASVFFINTTNLAMAQQHSNTSYCDELVTALCTQYWEEQGYYSYYNCYTTNVTYCDSQYQEGQGVYDQILLPGPGCHSVGGGPIYGC